MLTGMLIICVMLFPGLTINQYLDVIAILPTEYSTVLLLSLITQAVIIRYFQGIESRKLMHMLNTLHIAVLKEDLLPRIRVGTDNRITAGFLLLRMNKLMVQEFFRLFPVYAIVPNSLLIAEPAAREVLDSTGDEKSIKDML